MTTGEFVETPLVRVGVRLFLGDALIWAGVIVLMGGLAYGCALIF